MGEYLWLTEHRPDVAARMAEQWRDAVRRGHDVQLTFIRTGCRRWGHASQDGQLVVGHAAQPGGRLSGDLTQAIARCKAALEDAIRPVNPDYEVVAFRAGTYEAQPFTRLYDALVGQRIWCDSSVLPGDTRADRHYDYRDAYDIISHGSRRASIRSSRLRRRSGRSSSCLCSPSRRATSGRFDADEGPRFAARLAERLPARATPSLQ